MSMSSKSRLFFNLCSDDQLLNLVIVHVTTIVASRLKELMKQRKLWREKEEKEVNKNI